MDTAQPWRRSATLRFIRTTVVGAVMVVLLVAGALKLLDLRAFYDSLAGWPIPVAMKLPVALLVPAVEVLVGGAWLLRFSRDFCETLALGLVGSFLVVLVFALFTTNPPTCACLGLIDKYFEGMATVKAAIIRDALMLGALLGGFVLRPTPGPRGSSSVRPPPHLPAGGSPHARAGFTLIELLLVIAIVAVLLGLLSPVLRDLRRTADRTRTLANLSDSAKIFQLYASDFRGAFPTFMDPKATSTVFRLHSGHVEQVDGYFVGAFFWNFALADGYFDGDPYARTMFPAEQARLYRGGTPFAYPCTYFAAPAFWNPNTRSGSSQFASPGDKDVRFPSRKSLLVSCFEFFHPRPGGVLAPMALVDGSAVVPRLDQVRSGYGSGEGNYFPQSFHMMDWFCGLHTIDGVAGRDLE